MTAAVQVTVTQGPADAAQLASWAWLWSRLLVGDYSTSAGQAEAEHDATVQASTDDGDISPEPEETTIMIPHPHTHRDRKSDLIALGQWAMLSGRGCLVRAVHAALREEGLCDA